MPQVAIPWLIGAGIGLQVIGMVRQSRAERKAGKEAQVLAGKRADLMVAETEFNQISLRRQISALIGKSVTAYAGGGVVASSGSAADQRFDTAVFGDKVALFDRYVGLREAEIVRQGGDFAASQSRARASSTVLAGLGNALQSFGFARQEGVFGGP